MAAVRRREPKLHTEVSDSVSWYIYEAILPSAWH